MPINEERKTVNRNLRRIALWLFASALLSAQGGNGGNSAVAPKITKMLIVNSSVLQIQGSNFGTLRPLVVLDGAILQANQFTDAVIYAELPALPAGAYTVTVTNALNQQTGTSILTIGAAGPAGPAGPEGAVGPMGPAGGQGAP